MHCEVITVLTHSSNHIPRRVPRSDQGGMESVSATFTPIEQRNLDQVLGFYTHLHTLFHDHIHKDIRSPNTTSLDDALSEMKGINLTIHGCLFSQGHPRNLESFQSLRSAQLPDGHTILVKQVQPLL